MADGTFQVLKVPQAKKGFLLLPRRTCHNSGANLLNVDVAYRSKLKDNCHAMHEFHDDTTAASDRVTISISDVKLQKLEPDLYGPAAQSIEIPWGKRTLNGDAARRMLSEHMSFGDSRAALCVLLKPLLIAAHTDEQDAVLLLRFPDFLVMEHNLKIGDRLLTVNTYARGARVVPDIVLGPRSTGRWTNCYPIIAEFVSDNQATIHHRKQSITSEEWQRTAELGKSLMSAGSFVVRDGRPLQSKFPGKIRLTMRNPPTR